jgi:RNase P/RNase MRP subunit p30
MTDKTKSVKKEKLLKEYAKLAKKLKKSPRLADLVDAGYTKDMVGHHFQSLSRLDEEARKAYPDNFYNVTIDCLLNPKATQDLRDTVKGFKRFVITTAVTGCKVDMNFYKSIKTYCKIKDAALLILVASDPAHRDQHCDRRYQVEL